MSATDAASVMAVEDVASGPTLELRILSGMHAGARALLDGEQYTLGAVDDCDFVLSDPEVQPHHARLSRQDGRWRLDWVAENGEEPALAPVHLEPGRAVPLGPVVVAVDTEEAPWPTLEQLVLVPHAPALDPSLPPPTEPVPAAGPEGRARSVFGRRVLVGVSAAAALGLSTLAFVAWPMASRNNGAPGLVMATARPAPEQPQGQRQEIEAALKALGFGGRAKLEPTNTGWLVRAAVMSETEGESLTAALSRLQPPPALRMTTEQDLRDEVTDMLVRLAPEYRGSIRLRSLGEGRLRLEGRMANAVERDKLLRALSAAFPQVPGWDNAVFSSEEVAEKLVAELRARGFQVTSLWDKGTLEMEVRLQQRDVPRWERVLLAATQSHVVPFRARLALVAPAAAIAREEVRLPFQIRSVVGGDMPYVLLPDGGRLAPGGTWQGWRLAGVSASQVVFENGDRRAIVQR